jgi:GNAT superfamily N-acetyltransferase
MSTATLTFDRVRADDDAALREWFALRTEVQAADLPGDPALGWALHAGMLRHPWPGNENRAFLARRDGVLVGWLGLGLPLTENLGTATVDIEVAPAYRRQGVARAVLAQARRLAGGIGRSRLVAGVSGEAGEAFATAHGARRVLVDTQRRLDLTAVDDARLDALLTDAVAHSAGYSVLQWIGATPEEHLAAVAALESRMTTDAPMDDLQWEQEVFDADRMRGRDAVMTARRNRAYTTAARHDASGDVVGTTMLTVADGVDDAAGQWQTIVAPQHRGHRLGLLLKVANLRFLQQHERAVTRIDTWNADSNAPMLRVNVAMGFQPVRQWAEWELVL